MKLAVTTTAPDIEAALPVSLLAGSFEQRLEKAVALGYEGVELLVNRPEALDPRSIRAQVGARGLQIAAVSSGGLVALEKLTLLSSDSGVQDRAAQKLGALVEFAARAGAPTVTVGSFRGRQSAPGDRATLVEILRATAESAARLGVRLALEPLNRYETNLIHTTAEGLRFLSEVGHPHLGLLLDTYHANIEEPSLSDAFRLAAAAGRLFHVHLGDSNRRPPGYGHIDFASIFQTLRAMDYTGYCSAELLAFPDPTTAAAITAEYCRPYLLD
jgi:sugar phosphate isomerase/epimerase